VNLQQQGFGRAQERGGERDRPREGISMVRAKMRKGMFRNGIPVGKLLRSIPKPTRMGHQPAPWICKTLGRALEAYCSDNPLS